MDSGAADAADSTVSLSSTPLLRTERTSGAKHIANVLLMSISFLCVFAAYNATQNLVTTLVPGRLGYWSVASIYASFCFSALLLGPGLVSFLQPKASMILGSLTYAGFMAANLKPEWTTLIPTAVALGLGASILWAAEGVYLTAAASNYASARHEASKSAMGLFNGIFFGIFQCTQIIGNLLGSFILSYGGNTKFLFYIFLSIAGLGILLLFFLRPEESQHYRRKPSGASQILQALLLLKDPKMICLVPCLFYSGLEMAFMFGDFTKEGIADVLGAKWIGFIMAVFGAFDAVGSVLLGKISDAYGKRIVAAIGIFMNVAFFVFFLTLHFTSSSLSRDVSVVFVMAAVAGIGDAVWNTFPNTMLSVFFTDQTEAAFSNLKMWQSLGSVCSFVWGPFLPYYVKQMILLSTLVVVGISLVILDRFVAPIDHSRPDFGIQD